ncbi:MAG: type II toxin-antitoxin system HigB family toxin [Caldilineaceae bacterium]
MACITSVIRRCGKAFGVKDRGRFGNNIFSGQLTFLGMGTSGISSTLREFAARHPQARQPLDDWYRLTQESAWQRPVDIKLLFGSADILPNNRVVFNIGGNDYRLVVELEYKFQTVYIRFVETHAEYDRIDATSICPNDNQTHQK